ncbi:MAG: glycosyltransferase family 2 protein [Bacteroidales bacterium]|nr:glycosyltransferase family 2 protein [Bacteroidales bacterium]
MSNRPLVSIITVNYNQSIVTGELLQSLRSITYPNYEIIVVDNGSVENPDKLKESFPEIYLVKTGENLGFAGGNNRGIRVSKGKYLMFLNNDTEVFPGFLEPLVQLLEDDSTIGMVSPKIKYFRSPDIVQYAGFTKMNPYTIRNSGIGYLQPDGPEYDTISQTEYIHGAAMMVPRALVERVGQMPEIYFLYYEEYDWSEMFKRAGYKIYYHPGSTILHKESVTTGVESPLKTYYINRSRLIFTRRNYSGFQLVISLLFQTLISLPKNSLVFMLKGKLKNMLAYWRAYLWNITHLKLWL